MKSWRCNENCSTTSQGLSKTSQPCCSCVQKLGDFSLVFMGFPCATKSSSMWRGSQSTGCLRCRLEMLTLGVFCFGPVRYTFRPAHLQYSRLSQVDHILLQSILQRATTSPLRKLRELALFCHRKSRGSTRFAFQAAEQPKVIWNLPEMLFRILLLLGRR